MKIGTNEVERRVQAFSEVCRRYGAKATHQRREIYRELLRTDEHPAAETIYARVRKRIPAISLDTVYRTLRLLEKKGLISRAGFLNEKARFDANTLPHHHFVCTRCGFMGDIYHKERDEFLALRDVSAMGTVNSVHIELRGICKSCQKNSRLKDNYFFAILIVISTI
ncbi:MAG: transcriptional repressor [Syntrophaceae bacterium]|nr:transcriptional repressor [Syntrophaceae bacterium]